MFALPMLAVEKKEKKTVGVTLPPDFWAAFLEKKSSLTHGKANWVAVAAALLMFMEAREDDRMSYIDRINRAEVRGDYTAIFINDEKPEGRPYRRAAKG